MTGPTKRRLGHRSLLAAAAAALAAAGLAVPTTSVSAAPERGDVAKARFFSFNDFHGALDPPTGSGAAVIGVPAGGAEYLATTLKRLRADADANGQKALTAGPLRRGTPASC